MGNGQNILVIIPAYNEEGSVGKVVEKVHAHLPQGEVLVVNDGSMDLTSEKSKLSPYAPKIVKAKIESPDGTEYLQNFKPLFPIRIQDE
jgi:glycosyltransferase involved in cell wall biosynthesis